MHIYFLLKMLNGINMIYYIVVKNCYVIKIINKWNYSSAASWLTFFNFHIVELQTSFTFFHVSTIIICNSLSYLTNSIQKGFESCCYIFRSKSWRFNKHKSISLSNHFGFVNIHLSGFGIISDDIYFIANQYDLYIWFSFAH